MSQTPQFSLVDYESPTDFLENQIFRTRAEKREAERRDYTEMINSNLSDFESQIQDHKANILAKWDATVKSYKELALEKKFLHRYQKKLQRIADAKRLRALTGEEKKREKWLKGEVEMCEVGVGWAQEAIREADHVIVKEQRAIDFKRQLVVYHKGFLNRSRSSSV